MSMFDTIYTKVKCPNCKKTSVMGFQTKEGERMLSNFTIGDSFVFDGSEKETLYDLLSSCDYCNCFVDGMAKLENSVIKEIKVVSYHINLKKAKVYKNKVKLGVF